MDPVINAIVTYVKEITGLDFSGNRMAMLQRRIEGRMSVVNVDDLKSYLNYLEQDPDELKNLTDVLTINVSSFFRDSLNFEYIAQRILPALVTQKKGELQPSLRVWSAGCATGEEPYSVAILLHALLKKEQERFHLNIFATDIDAKALQKAQSGIYPLERIENVKFGLVKAYFTCDDHSCTLKPEIRQMVSFSFYDLLDTKTYAPPESVFGHFDLILCRNVLIYFESAYQDIIFDKLFRALAVNGYLILGEVEQLPINYQSYFVQDNDYCQAYRKYRGACQ